MHRQGRRTVETTLMYLGSFVHLGMCEASLVRCFLQSRKSIRLRALYRAFLEYKARCLSAAILHNSYKFVNFSTSSSIRLSLIRPLFTLVAMYLVSLWSWAGALALSQVTTCMGHSNSSGSHGKCWLTSTLKWATLTALVLQIGIGLRYKPASSRANSRSTRKSVSSAAVIASRA